MEAIQAGWPELDIAGDTTVFITEVQVVMSGIGVGCLRPDGVCRSKGACDQARACLQPGQID